MAVSKKIKILHVVRTMNVGGLENFVRSLLEYRADDLVCDCLICDLDVSDYEKDLTEAGIRIYKIKAPFGTKRKFSQDMLSFFKAHDAYDVVHAHMAFTNGIIGCMAKKCKIDTVVFHSHGMSVSKKISLKEKFFRCIMRRTMRRTGDEFLACSQSAGDFLFGKKFFEKNGRVVKNGIDLSKFVFCDKNRNQIRNSMNIHGESLVLGHCGSLCDNKNQKLILSIARKLTEEGEPVEVFLLGDGKAKKELGILAKELGIKEHVFFLGNQQEVGKYLSAMDIFVFPSISEGFGLALIEAQASGLPCVVSDSIQEEAKAHCDKIISVSLSAPLEDWAWAVKEAKKIRRYDGRPVLERAGLNLESSVLTIRDVYKKRMNGKMHEQTDDNNADL